MRRKLEWSGEGEHGAKRVGKGGHQRALTLRILNRRHMYNFGLK